MWNNLKYFYNLKTIIFNYFCNSGYHSRTIFENGFTNSKNYNLSVCDTIILRFDITKIYDLTEEEKQNVSFHIRDKIEELYRIKDNIFCLLDTIIIENLNEFYKIYCNTRMSYNRKWLEDMTIMYSNKQIKLIIT